MDGDGGQLKTDQYVGYMTNAQGSVFLAFGSWQNPI